MASQSKQSHETYPHTGYLTVGRRAFSGFADGEVEERQEVEDIGQRSVQPVVVDGMVIADLIKTRHCTREGCGVHMAMDAS